MAYDTVERFPKLITPTPADVGPGTYDVTDVTCPKKQLADVYPFLCGAKRETFTISKHAMQVPGPATYSIKEPQKHIPERIGGVSMDFTDSRFKVKEYVGPGPTEYDVKEDMLKCGKMRSHPGTWRGPPGKLLLGRPPPSILPVTVSVPDKNHTGYSTDEHGVFTKNPPIEHEPPFLYDIPREETNTTTLLYKGNFWSRMTGRSGPRPSLTPGPGDYEIETKKTASQLRDEKIREARKMSSRQIRSLDIMYRRLVRENLPAPNRYNVKGTFDRFNKSSCKCDRYAVKQSSFGGSAKRFEDKKSDIPGPGTYDPQTQTKCDASNFLAPFGTYARRFKRIQEDTGPAPSDYHSNVGNLAYEVEKRFKYSCWQQKQPIVFKNTYSFIEVKHYDTPRFSENGQVKKLAVYHAAFKSRTDRFPKSEKMDVPDPGAYEVAKAFKVNRNPCEVPSRPAAFGTRGSRFPKRKSDKDFMPDPTYYDVSGDISKDVKGGAISLATNIENKFRASVPGPSHYHMHPYMSSTILKRSFNVKLNKPKVITKTVEEEEAIVKTRCPCVRKKLRWFMVPREEYNHCSVISV